MAKFSLLNLKFDIIPKLPFNNLFIFLFLMSTHYLFMLPLFKALIICLFILEKLFILYVLILILKYQ